MVDSPREVVGAVLKHMGASYNTKDIESQVVGGREAVLHNLTMLQRQVKKMVSDCCYLLEWILNSISN